MKRVDYSNRGNAADKARTALVQTMLGKETAGRLPPKVLEQFKGVFEGKQIPRSKTVLPSRQFMEGFAAACEKEPIGEAVRRLGRLIELNAPKMMIDGEIDGIAHQIGMLLHIAGKSPRPSAYLKFLSSPDLKLADFFDGMEILAQRQDISFEPLEPSALETGTRLVEAITEYGISRECMTDFLCERIVGVVEGIGGNTGSFDSSDILIPQIFGQVFEQYGIYYYQKQKALLRFDRIFRHGRTRIYVLNGHSFMNKKGWGGLAIGGDCSDILLTSESKRSLQHELQHLFDSRIGVGGEQAGKEFRAKLAQIAFTDVEEAKEKERLKANILLDIVMDRPDWSGHHAADLKLLDTMVHGRKEDLPWHERALWYLNREYKRLCGLSYEQIMGPFARN